jgi:hypothetical protein
MNDRTFSEIQALNAMILDTYNKGYLLCKPEIKRGQRHAGKMQQLQIRLGELFGNTKEGREHRLDTLVAILPILEWDGKPIDMVSTTVLLMAEIHALVEWLKSDTSMDALEDVSKNHEVWRDYIREHLGYIRRPVRNVRQN